MSVAVVFNVEIARVSLLKRSVITSMYWLPCIVLGKDILISIATKPSGLDTEKSWKL